MQITKDEIEIIDAIQRAPTEELCELLSGLDSLEEGGPFIDDLRYYILELLAKNHKDNLIKGDDQRELAKKI
jgi:hypothetical protein